MIWAIDAIWMLVAILLSTAGFMAASGVGPTSRSALVVGTFTMLIASYLYLATPVHWNAWLIGGGLVAAAAASVAPARYATSLVVLLALAFALVGLRGCPVGMLGLLHHVALVDLAGACLAVCCLGVQDSGRLSQEATTPQGEDSPQAKPRPLPPLRIARRAGVMLLVMCLILTWAIARQGQLFGLPLLIGLCAGGSEILAAVVAWRVIHEWLLSVHSLKQRSAGYRLGLLIAGLASAITLIMVPVVISALRDLSAHLPS